MRLPRWPLLPMLVAVAMPALHAQPRAAASGAPAPATFAGLRFRNIGPASTGGRIGDIAIHPRAKSTWVIGVASGGSGSPATRGRPGRRSSTARGAIRSAPSPSIRTTR